jgi:hypothetical protein
LPAASAVVTVTRVSTMDMRWFADAAGHFLSMYSVACWNQEMLRSERSLDRGKPVLVSKPSPRRAAWMSSERSLSAKPSVPNHFENGLPATFQRTP